MRLHQITVGAAVAVALTLSVGTGVGHAATESYPSTVHDLSAAWARSTGSGVTVAVVGTSGVNARIGELQGRVLAGHARSGDGRTDSTGHDTGVASVIAAARNGTGVTGVAPSARIVPAVSDWCAGLDDVVRRGATVVAIPQLTHVDIPCLRQAVARAVAKDVVVIAGVGNSGREERRATYPADYPGVIGVGAVDETRWRPSWATVGPSVDLVAPGHDVLIANRDGGYDRASGSSYSTGYVAGVAALVRSAHPSWTAATVTAALTSTATDLGATGRDWWFGDGLVDPARAVRG